VSSLRMHWRLVQGADGKKFLGMHWEASRMGQLHCRPVPRQSMHDAVQEMIKARDSSISRPPAVAAV
jgi:hypothetical protein